MATRAILKVVLQGEPPAGWESELSGFERDPSRGWLYFAVSPGFDRNLLDQLKTAFHQSEGGISEFIRSWLMDVHRWAVESNVRPKGVIVWIHSGGVDVFPLGGVHVFHKKLHSQSCLTDPLYDFTRYVRWNLLSPGDEGYKPSWAHADVDAGDQLELVAQDSDDKWSLVVTEKAIFEDPHRSREYRPIKRGPSRYIPAGLVVLVLIGLLFVWAKFFVPKPDVGPGGIVHTSTTATTATGGGESTVAITPLSLWDTASITSIATQTLSGFALSIEKPCSITALKATWGERPLYVAMTDDLGSAVRLRILEENGYKVIVDKSTTLVKPWLKAIVWPSAAPIVTLDLSGGEVVLKAPFSGGVWGRFKGLSDAALNKIVDADVDEVDGTNKAVAVVLLPDRFIVYKGRAGGEFEAISTPIYLPPGYVGQRVALGDGGNVWVLGCKERRGGRSCAIIKFDASNAYIPDEAVKEFTQKLLDNLDADFYGPLVVSDGRVMFAETGVKDGLAVLNPTRQTATLYVAVGPVYPLGGGRYLEMVGSMMNYYVEGGGR